MTSLRRLTTAPFSSSLDRSTLIRWRASSTTLRGLGKAAPDRLPHAHFLDQAFSCQISNQIGYSCTGEIGEEGHVARLIPPGVDGLEDQAAIIGLGLR